MQEPFIIVTGAAGFIGSGVVKHLNDLGHQNLILVDDFQTKNKWKNLVCKRYALLISKHELMSWLEGKENQIKAIIHLGACSSTAWADDDYLVHNNYRYSVALAEYAIRHGIRMIYASSAATYGDGSQGFSDEKDIARLSPMNMYGYSKQLFDLWLQRSCNFANMVGLKYFNVFGPNEYHKGKMASGVFHLAKQAIEQKAVYLFKSNDPENYADGEQRRDFIYVKDVAKITCQFLEKPYWNISGLFNVGTAQSHTWNEIARAIFKALNIDEDLHYIDMPKELLKQYQNYTEATMDKYRTALKEQAVHMTSLEDAIKDYINNYLLDEARW